MCAVCIALSCNTAEDGLVYEPQVTFTGIIEQGTIKERVTFFGRLETPNTCYLRKDTLIMYFYSDDYVLGSSAGISSGKLLRIRIMPFPDTLDQLTMRHVQTHLAQYTPENRSYYSGPSDTATLDPNVVSVAYQPFRRRSGNAIKFYNMRIGMYSAPGSNNLVACEIRDGEIQGKIGW